MVFNRIVRAVTSAAIAVIAVSPAAALATNFAGTWAVSGTLGERNIAPVCAFRQSGSSISGTCKGPNSVGPIVGSVIGSSIQWQWHMTPTTSLGRAAISTFRGTLGQDGVIRGTWGYVGLAASGQFTAQRP